MKDTFSHHGTRWWYNFVSGTDYILHEGIAGTVANRNGHFQEGFPLLTTVILGDSGKVAPLNQDDHTVAEWRLPTNTYNSREDEVNGHIIIACVRGFGGLHSPVLDDRAVVDLNDKVIDGFELKELPLGHQDYFHIQQYPNIPKPYPISLCKTIYSWPIPPGHFSSTGLQHVKLRIDKTTKWDIDYVGLLLKMHEPRHRVFISYSHADKPIARRLAGALKKEGIPVWIDEGEMKLGDSLIERVRSAIDEVDYVVALLSNRSVRSGWVRKELDIAIHKEIEGKLVKVIVIRIEEVPVPTFLAEKLYADLFDENAIPLVVAQIVQRLQDE